ncbi:MAG: zinc ribbon domain-containing protein [Sedimentisphaerales bacterium]|nr:zinc ribbon domain-containing protein [Sedimentisphaerales bacterium]
MDEIKDVQNWECSKCHEQVDQDFEVCWNCGMAQYQEEMEIEEGSQEGETGICPGCLREIQPGRHFCPHCNTPLTTHAATDPIGRIHATGDTYRKALKHPSKIAFVGMWLLFGSSLILMLWLLGIMLSNHPESKFFFYDIKTFGGVFILIMLIGSITIDFLILTKITKNYYRRDRDIIN